MLDTAPSNVTHSNHDHRPRVSLTYVLLHMITAVVVITVLIVTIGTGIHNDSVILKVQKTWLTTLVQTILPAGSF